MRNFCQVLDLDLVQGIGSGSNLSQQTGTQPMCIPMDDDMVRAILSFLLSWPGSLEGSRLNYGCTISVVVDTPILFVTFDQTIKTSSASGSQDSIANPRSGSRMHGVGGVGSSMRICNFLQFQPFSIHRRIAWKAANLL